MRRTWAYVRAHREDKNGVVLGAVIVAIVVVVVLPVSFFAGGAAISAMLGWLLRDNGIATHEGSELIDLNR